MRVVKVSSISDIPYDDWQPVAKTEHRGKFSLINLGNDKRTIMVILPCGHTAVLDGWKIQGIDTESPSATPSIFCHGQNGADCWHGYLTDGELKSV